MNLSEILDSTGLLLQQANRTIRTNGTNRMNTFVFMGFCFSHFKIITKNRMKSKKKFEIQIFIDVKLHQQSDIQ